MTPHCKTKRFRNAQVLEATPNGANHGLMPNDEFFMIRVYCRM